MKLSTGKKGLINWVLQCQSERLIAVQCTLDDDSNVQIKQVIDMPCTGFSNIPWERFKGARVLIGLGPEHCESAILKAPDVSDEEILSALQWELAESTGIDVEHYEFEGFEIPGSDRGGLNAKYWWVGAVKKTLVQELLALADDANVRRVYINAHPLMYRGWFAGNKIELATGCIFLEDHFGCLSFFKQDELLFTKQLDWGKESRQKEHFWEEAELELQRNLDYFDRRLSTIATQKIWVIGEGAVNLCQALSGRFSVPFEVLDGDAFLERSADVSVDVSGLKNQYALLGHLQCLGSIRDFEEQKK